MNSKQDSAFEAWVLSTSGAAYDYYNISSSINDLVRPVISLKNRLFKNSNGQKNYFK